MSVFYILMSYTFCCKFCYSKEKYFPKFSIEEYEEENINLINYSTEKKSKKYSLKLPSICKFYCLQIRDYIFYRK
jgi:hypothetical protein